MTILTAAVMSLPALAQKPNLSRATDESPRALLDETAGFPSDESVRNLQRVTEETELRRVGVEERQKHQALRRQRILQIRAQREDSVSDDVEKHLAPLRLEEAMLKEQLGADHPKLKAIRKRIELTEQYYDQRAADSRRHREHQKEHERDGQNDRFRHELSELSERSAKVEAELNAVQNALRNTEDKEERRELESEVEELTELRAKTRAEIVEVRQAIRDRKVEIDKRMKQVHAMHESAEKLKSNGLHDVAHELHRRAEEMEQDIRRHHDGYGAPEQQIEELFHNMHDLRHEVRELHEKLDRILRLLEEGEDRKEGLGVSLDRSSIVPSGIQPNWWNEEQYGEL